MKNSILIVFFLLGNNLFFAQENRPTQDDSSIEGQSFKQVNEFYIYGDSRIIGNNILSVNKTQPFNDVEANNDDLEMLYVDIDNDPETFSSSSALLNLPDDLEKISYAGLYWSATYPYDTGTRHKNYNNFVYKGHNKRKKNIEKIKFKTPNGKYQDIEGEIIYDGINVPTHTINAPYVCYAEVTDILKNIKEVKGNYTVANIKAANGFISGGSAGGWLLYVIYKAPTKNAKYIATYNGFSLVNKNTVDIKFKNFKSIDQGYVKTDLFLSALEGDASLLLDDVSIIKNDKTFLPLLNDSRKTYNFFNSSITKYSCINTTRLPSSKNTLGFDIARIKIPNYKKSIISNDITSTILRFKTKSDRYYLFFTAFQTEISQTPFNNKVEIKPPVIASKQPKHQIISRARIKPSFNETKTDKSTLDEKLLKRKDYNSDEFKNLVNQKSTLIAGLKSGYYVITNAFTNAKSAGKWEASLITKGYNPKTFIDPKNNKRYVYVLKTESAKEAFKKQQDIIQDVLYREAWILKINLD